MKDILEWLMERILDLLPPGEVAIFFSDIINLLVKCT